MPQRPNDSRRRFIKAGLVTAPVIVTLSARPAWANGEVNGTLGTYGDSAQGLTGDTIDPFTTQTVSTPDEPNLF